MRENRLTNPDQLVKGMVVSLCSEVYGRDRYTVDCNPYQLNSGKWFVMLTHLGSITSMEYSLDELGITMRSYMRWVDTEKPL